MINPTNAQLFAFAGRHLFGERWTQPTAELLGWPLDERGQNRTVQRIKSAAERGEDYRIAPGVWRDLAKAATERAEALDAMANALVSMAELAEEGSGRG